MAPATQRVVIPAKAGIQYAAAYRPIVGVSGILDHPLSRMTTVVFWVGVYLLTLTNSFSKVAASLSPTAEYTSGT